MSSVGSRTRTSPARWCRLADGTLVLLLLFLLMLHAAGAAPAAADPLSNEAIQGKVETIRGLGFKAPVATEVQSAESFRTYVTEALDRQFGDDGSEGFVQALVKLGVLREKLDMTKTYLSLAESQAAAHYDPHTKTYYLLMTNMPSIFMGVTTSHELCHALQDQHFDLKNFLEGDLDAVRANGDAAAARQCLVEGDATYVMTVWMLLNQMGSQALTNAETMAAMSISMQTMLDLETIVAMSQTQLKELGQDAETMMKAVEEMARLPRFFVESMYAAYIHGAMMICHVKSRGGWEAVNALFKNPPRSTEQVLHPAKLVGDRDDPVEVRFPGLAEQLGDRWVLREEDVLGELGIRIFFRMWRTDRAEKPSVADASTGWDGDRYCYYENEKTGKDLLVWKTVWDTPKDAEEFEASYRMTLAARFPDRKQERAGGRKGMLLNLGWGRVLKLYRKQHAVWIIDTTERRLLKTLSTP